MSVNFSTGVSVGQTGSFGQYIGLTEQRHKKDELWLGAPSSLYGYCVTQGINENSVLNKIERGIGYNEGSLSWGRSVTNNDNNDAVLFVDSAGTFAQLDFSNYTYEIKSERQLTSSFCDWSQGRPYDGYTVTQGGFTFYQLFSTGLGDGKQDSIFINRQKNDLFAWGLTSFLQIEVPTA